jgi:hypothetical protein
MDYKKKYKDLVSQIKAAAKRENGKPLRNEDIAERLGYERSYFSTLLGERGEVTEKHVRVLQNEFREELDVANNNILEDDEGTYKSIAQNLREELKQTKEHLAALQKSLDTLLQRQLVIAAMTDAAIEPLLVELAQRKKLSMTEVRRSVRNRATSKLGQYHVKGIEIDHYT